MIDFVMSPHNPRVALTTTGGKGASLHQLIDAGLPVFGRFVVATDPRARLDRLGVGDAVLVALPGR